jgi:hypothetical protein
LAPVTRTAIALDGGLHLELAVLDQALDFLGHFGLDAVAHLDHLLDLVAAHFLHVARVQKAHIHVALGQLVAQHVFDLVELEFGVADQGDFLVLDLNDAEVPLKSKRVAISLAVFSTPFLTSTRSASQTVSKEGMQVRSGNAQ